MQEDPEFARRLSALEELGLERVDAPVVPSEVLHLDSGTHKVSCSRPAMATLVSITALGPSKDLLEDVIGSAFEEVDRLVALLSRYDSSSAVSYLNDQGQMTGLPPEFSRLVSRSLQFNELTWGAFDISVEPILDLFKARLESGSPVDPSSSEISEAMELVGSRHIELTADAVEFKRPGMAISLNGIAKGYVVDAIAAVLEGCGVESYLIDAGGDVRAGGTKEAGLPWTVAVQDPEKNGRFPDTVHLKDVAVATAGSYEKQFGNSRRFHHIVNAETGMSPHDNLSVSVVAPSAMAADALATSVFVMHPRMGIRFIETLNDCECLIVDGYGMVRKSKGWRSAASNNG